MNKCNAVNLMSGQDCLAIGLVGGEPAGDQFSLAMEIVPSEPSQFREYIFTRGPGEAVLTGSDDSPLPQVLQFSARDVVRVQLNGLDLEPETFDRSVDSRILFSKPFHEPTNVVRILVFLPTENERLFLNFNRVASDCSTRSSWSNVAISELYLDNSAPALFSMFICECLGEVPSGTQLLISKDQLTGNDHATRPDHWFFFLSFEPHTGFDRDLGHLVDIDSLIEEQPRLTLETNEQGGRQLTVAEEYRTSVFPLIVPANKCLEDQDTGQTAIHDNSKPSVLVV